MQVYRLSYDAYTHIFFADHYRRDWFNLWEPRWYGGFSMTTYPPLVHQTIALISFLVQDVETAYQILAVVAHTSLVYSAYLFSRIFIDEDEAQYAAVVAALLPAAGTVLNAFGQLPTIISSSLALIAAHSYSKYLTSGTVKNMTLAGLWTAASALAHHFTFLFFVPATQLPVFIRSLRMGKSTIVKRTLLHMLVTSSIILFILWPFIISALTPTPWKEIPHGTRQNIFSNMTLAAVFFWGMYSFTILLSPCAVAVALRRKSLIPLLAVFSIIFIIGLGGTTPIPSLILGDLWPILTYDRFAFWAALTYVPFLGVIVNYADAFSTKFFFGEKIEPAQKSRARTILIISFLSGLAVSYSLASTSIMIFRLQPLELLNADQLNMLAKFLDDNRQWKYITLGFGNQRILLSSKTLATTLDGGYNLAKTNTLLVSSGVESLDAAKYFPNGLSFLKEVLTNESNNGLRYVLSADEYYDAILRENGLRIIFTVDGPRRITVWEIPYSIVGKPSGNITSHQFVTILWSIGPMIVLLNALLLGAIGQKTSI